MSTFLYPLADKALCSSQMSDSLSSLAGPEFEKRKRNLAAVPWTDDVVEQIHNSSGGATSCSHMSLFMGL